ncbi:DUF2189 domain-containing protein [Crenobacter cavernae]|uniref:DUF2189 domain-containing protein n=1 Tax=Crenobacter cavernae TaxID=2290923 RepID=A0ABY0FBT4_9NEIS|nr:DUF2189 domain-containing protein [Crenobacter cavernae]RXZ43536.1 DUF2189 domain-containing protein [Crenobacter cavernae]
MDITHLPSHDHPVVRHVTPAHTLRWLKMGYKDFKRAPADCAFYGVIFVVMGFFLAFYFDQAPQYVITFSTIFLLAGPFLALGLYDVARQLEAFGGRVNLMHTITSWRVNMPAFTLYAALLTVLVFGWFRMSLLMFALFFEGPLPSLDQVVSASFTVDNIGFLVAYFGTGFFFALLVYAISAVSIPMMLDKEIDTISAMVTSLVAVYKNLLTMLLWAAIIVAMTVIGFLTYYVGLLFLMPIVALASWHAYRDLIAYELDQ